MPPPNTSLLSRIFNGVCNKVFELIKRCLHEVNETDDSLHVCLHVPGLCKDDLKICVDHKTLTLTIKDANETEQGPELYAIYDLTGKPYNIHQTKARMKDDGELNVVVPKINQKEKRKQERNEEGVRINVTVSVEYSRRI